MNVTTDLNKFGYIELTKAIELLTTLKDGKIENSGNDFDINSELKLMFNTGSDFVFLGNEEGQSYLINENGLIEEWVYCSECGKEGFYSEFKMTEELNVLCEDCYNKGNYTE